MRCGSPERYAQIRMVLRVGILGGLGPGATLDFMSKVVTYTPAARDQDHLPMLVDHNPRVPPRQRGEGHDETGIRAELRAMAERLEHAGAHFLVMPCNTAHAFLDEALAATTIPFVSIIDATLGELRSLHLERVGLLATDGCLRAELYPPAFVAAGLEPVSLANASQARFMRAVFDIKAGERDPEPMASLAAELVDSGAQAILVACTEVPLVLHRADVPLVSSTDALARLTVRIALGDVPLPKRSCP